MPKAGTQLNGSLIVACVLWMQELQVQLYMGPRRGIA